MNTYNSRTCLLDADFTGRVYTDESEGSSSGYESTDTPSSDDESIYPTFHRAPSACGRDAGPREIMMFTNTGDLFDNLAFILDMPELCDVTFLVGRELVPVHGVKAIIATRSRCLYQLLLRHQRKQEQEILSRKKSKKDSKSFVPGKLTIDVTDYHSYDFSKFMTFVHSGKVKVDMTSVVGLLCAAVEFGFRDLHSACIDFIQRCSEGDYRDQVIASAWRYQHKKAAQKLIGQMCDVAR